MNDLYVVNYTPHLGVVIAILTILPLIIVSIALKGKKVKFDTKSFESKLNICKYAILFAIMLILCFKKNILNIANANLFMGTMMFFYIMYYELVIKFMIGEKEESKLYTPFVYVKVPVQISMALGLFFCALWSKNILLILLSIAFGILHIYTSYSYYVENFRGKDKLKSKKDKRSKEVTRK